MRRSFRDLCAAMKAIGAYDTRRILREKLPMMRTINYIERQEQDLTQLEDYWRMAAVAGCDLNQDAVRWPKDLRTAHDRMSENNTVRAGKWQMPASVRRHDGPLRRVDMGT